LAAAEKAHLTEIIDRRLHRDPHHLALAMRLLDLGMRHLDEVGILQHGGEGIDQVGIGHFLCGIVEARMRIELGIEVVMAQPLELVEVFVVIDRGQEAADLAELLPFRRAGERSMLDQRVEQVRLAHRDELVPLVGRAARIIRRHCTG
jgi:hypothetical protein